MALLTNRDREYLRILYLLKGKNQPVGPVKLSKKLGVSKVCAFQKMHRLQALGYGTYLLRNGLKLNSKAISIVEQDVKRHHIIEAFLQKKLGLTHQQACIEAEQLDQSMSQRLFNKINTKETISSQSCCGYNLTHKLKVSDLKNCPWIQRSLCKTKDGEKA
ncbi:MAG: metal-dependent transcriptional regulator [Candidatus Thermoplasmatota archaeon]|nr:metal-dependent transcriptional regulator [Candidatus Thermoplasmatota archaeon]MBS3801901.1 metal-dependent transcriptional regulator [Candidatus Thermoplasmatota archaeon]